MIFLLLSRWLLAARVTYMVCGAVCPTCRAGCNRAMAHSGKHRDRSHAW